MSNFFNNYNRLNIGNLLKINKLDSLGVSIDSRFFSLDKLHPEVRIETLNYITKHMTIIQKPESKCSYKPHKEFFHIFYKEPFSKPIRFHICIDHDEMMLIKIYGHNEFITLYSETSNVVIGATEIKRIISTFKYIIRIIWDERSKNQRILEYKIINV